MPVYVHVIDHPDARVLVDTGMTELHPAVADLDPRLRPLSKQDFDLAGIDIVVNTHLHLGGANLTATAQVGTWSVTCGDARRLDQRLRCIPRMSHTVRIGLRSSTVSFWGASGTGWSAT
jgi:N-acyl homoserine lactone hydrolase